MKITLLQTAPEWGNPERSREDARRMLMGTQKTDLVVLPEMFSTGFVTNPVGVAESEEGDSLHWMLNYAHDKDCAVAGSVSVQTSEGYRNRFYFVFPDGHYIYYDKHHLFTYAGEHERYTGKYKTVAHNGKRVALFAHQGFGLAFLSCVLDIPYPQFCTHFDITPTGMTVIEFTDNGGYTIPKVLMHSSDSHIYKEGMLTLYNGCIKI